MENEQQLPSDSLTPEEAQDLDNLAGEPEPTLEHTATERRLYKRLKDTEAELKAFKSQPKDLPKDETPPPPKDNFDSLVESVSVIKDLTQSELSEMRAEARSLGLDPVKYIQSKGGQAYLKEYRQVKKAEESTPSPSRRGIVTREKPMSEQSPAERQAAFEARQATRFQKG